MGDRYKKVAGISPKAKVVENLYRKYTNFLLKFFVQG